LMSCGSARSSGTTEDVDQPADGLLLIEPSRNHMRRQLVAGCIEEVSQ
jgi:hypothetical protein